MDLISGLRRSPGKGNGLPTPVFLPGESMDRGARQAIVQRVTKSWTWLKWLSTLNIGHTGDSEKWKEKKLGCFKWNTLVNFVDENHSVSSPLRDFGIKRDMCRWLVVYYYNIPWITHFWLYLKSSFSWPDNICLWSGLHFETWLASENICLLFCVRLQFCLISVWEKWHLYILLPRKTLGVSGSGLG